MDNNYNEWVTDYDAWVANVQDDCTPEQWTLSSTADRWDVLIDLVGPEHAGEVVEAKRQWLIDWVDESNDGRAFTFGFHGKRVYARGGTPQSVHGLARRGEKAGRQYGANATSAWAVLP
jgi:hypothetical protein